MPTSSAHKHRFFSPVSYLTLPYVTYFVLSSMAAHYFIPVKLRWLTLVLSLTWLPAMLPLGILIPEGGNQTVASVVLTAVVVVCDIYFWAWLITKISHEIAENRRRESEK
ncbi:MAG: hypothetical protein IAG10_17685 [Planctomycetaceae bacterium]|nr:hypothetical protein [Planctomycetaceae bacterium]